MSSAHGWVNATVASATVRIERGTTPATSCDTHSTARPLVT